MERELGGCLNMFEAKESMIGHDCHGGLRDTSGNGQIVVVSSPAVTSAQVEFFVSDHLIDWTCIGDWLFLQITGGGQAKDLPIAWDFW